MKKFFASTIHPEKMKIVIEEDQKAGFYLIVYPEGSAKSVADYLLDDLDAAFGMAEKKYGVTHDSWKEVWKKGRTKQKTGKPGTKPGTSQKGTP